MKQKLHYTMKHNLARSPCAAAARAAQGMDRKETWAGKSLHGYESVSRTSFLILHLARKYVMRFLLGKTEMAAHRETLN